MKKCPYCGKLHQDENTLFCAGCGANMGTPFPERETKTSSKEKKLWLTVILLLVALTLAVAAIFVVSSMIDKDGSAEVSSSAESKDKEDKKKKKKSDDADEASAEAMEEEEEKSDSKKDFILAEATANDFMDAFIAFDTEGMKAVVYDTKNIPDELQRNFTDKLLDSVQEDPDAAIFIGYEDELVKIFDSLCENLQNNTTYKFTNTYEKDGCHVFEVTSTMPDADKYNLEDYFSEEEVYGIVMKLYIDGKITEDMSEQEMIAAAMPALLDLLHEAFSEIDMTLHKKDITGTLVVKEYDGEWLVCAKDSNLTEFETYYK